MSRIMSLVSAVTFCVALAGTPATYAHSGRPNPSSPQPVQACENLSSLDIENVTINGVLAHPGDATTPSSCRVTATYSHPGLGDAILIWTWLPTTNWNGRFQGVGGGGNSGGSENSLATPLRAGYAAVATNGGHVGGSPAFVRAANGRLDWTAVRNFAFESLHFAARVGKEITRAYYGSRPRYAYFVGCSTGGRQALALAQRYPHDYDGIVAGAPVSNHTELASAMLWPALSMLWADNAVCREKLQAAQAAIIAACDQKDGVQDGVIDEPRRCNVDMRSLVGIATPCGVISSEDAEIVGKILEGPRTGKGGFKWYGQEPGTSFVTLANTTAQTPPQPLAFAPLVAQLQFWVVQDPTWDWRELDNVHEYEALYHQFHDLYDAVIGGRQADLSEFEENGGKLLLWHGWADAQIFPGGTVNYYDRIQDTMGSAKARNFVRLFMAPGVDHCGGGPGTPPTGQLDALKEWVERGRAPHKLDAMRLDASGNVLRTKIICEYPLVARYSGRGSTDDAANFSCRR